LTTGHTRPDATRDVTSDAVALFLHIPKCAGTSFTKLVYLQYYDPQGPEHPDDDFPQGIYYIPDRQFLKARSPQVADRALPILRDPQLRAVAGHFCFGLHELIPRPAGYLTLLRDPLERVVSLYHHLRWRDSRFQLGDRGRVFDSTTSVEELVTEFELREIDNDQVLEQAKANLESFWLVGTTERFEDTLAAAHLRLDWPAHIDYSESNVNTSRPPAAELPAATQELILARNELDLELHSFADALLDEHLRAGPRSGALPTSQGRQG
jgi:hypothetical protein